MQNKIVINNLSELPIAAKQLLQTFPDKRIFAFIAQMGVGKTTFIKAICEELGVTDTISSPTFSIVNEYLSNKGIKIYHFDFYRIKSSEEVYDMGYEDYFYSNAYCFIEWSEKITNLLPEGFVSVEMIKEEEKRIINFQYFPK